MSTTSYFDTREELGVAGYIEYPYRFYRDEVYYDAIWFYNSSPVDRADIDIYFATDITPDYNLDRYTQLSTFTSVWNAQLERYDIIWDYAEIPLTDRKDKAYIDTDSECSQIIYSNWSPEAQSNVALGIYSDEMNAQCRNDIAKMLQDNQTNMDTIDSITTQEEMDAYKPIWSLDL